METLKNHMNPYIAGVLLGLVLIASVLISGRGLGASGAVKSCVVSVVSTVAPEHTNESLYYEQHVNNAPNPLKSWLVFEVLGVIIGGFLSGMLSNRLTLRIDKGPRISSNTRLIFAFAGGILFSFGAQFGRGCTSGAALSGMGVLSTGGFITMLAIFGSGYLFAYFFRKLWI
ncbi:MAG: YeeE/YedE family protein [Bacteroidales bacterium]|nr:YeeE/YedE family protein [Bacteroidales bacterium]